MITPQAYLQSPPNSQKVELAKETRLRQKTLFTGQEEHRMSFEGACILTRFHRQKLGEEVSQGAYLSRSTATAILRQESCIGMRVYWGKHISGDPVFVFVGVEPNGNDLFRGILGKDVWLSEPASLNPLNSEETEITQHHERTLQGTEQNYVSLAEASELTRTYRKDAESRSIKGGYFSESIFRHILFQPGCVGIHIYLAQHHNGPETLVLVGTNHRGIDLICGVIGEDILPCPPWCSVANPLNT